jgi:hypothetical protein
MILVPFLWNHIIPIIINEIDIMIIDIKNKIS